MLSKRLAEVTITKLYVVFIMVMVNAVVLKPKISAPFSIRSMDKITFDSSCKVGCYLEFCMPASVLCKQLQGKHECCGGIGVNVPSTRRPPLRPTLPTTKPQDCSKVSTEFCATVPTHTCCTNPPQTRKPATLICLYGTCTSEPIRLRYPACKITKPPKFGQVTLTVKLYCRHINKNHKCCTKSQRPPVTGRAPTDKPQGPAALPPNITVTIHPAITVPGCFGKSMSLGKRLRRLGYGGGGYQRLRRNGKDNLEDDDSDICKTQPSHPCCVGNMTETPPVLPPSGVTPEVIIIKPHPNKTEETPDILPVPCEEYTDDLHQCRQTPGCGISCGDRSCRRKTSIPVQCTSQCGSHCENLCACKMSGCEYHSITGNCRPSSAHCHNRHFPIGGECRRSNHYYSHSGELCLNSHEGGNCQMEETILAVNLGNGDELEDSRGIPYQADNDVEYKDSSGIRQVAEALKVFGANDQDLPLYKTVIHGGTESRGQDKCVVYSVPLCQDGNYELAIRTLENYHTFKGGRHFNIKFNGQLVFPELDILSLTGNTYSIVNLAVNFQVQNNGTTLVINGFQPTLTTYNAADLEFCQSSCDKAKDPNFIVSAFSVVRFANPVESRRSKKSKGSCQQWHFQLCQCKKNGCEFQVDSENCHEGDLVGNLHPSGQCGKPGRSRFAGPKCRRAGILYADGGLIYKYEESIGSCDIAETIFAVNINGGALEDSRGVIYEADREELFKDPWGTRIARVFNQFDVEETRQCRQQDSGRFVENIPPEEIPLYETFIRGNSTKRELGRCISYVVPNNVELERDGKYELCLKFVEFLYPEYKMRFFNVRFAGILVLPEFDILEYTQKCLAIDVIVPFEVSDDGSRITVLGHAEKELGDEPVALWFCYGECYLDQFYVDPDFLISAFYIARIDE